MSVASFALLSKEALLEALRNAQFDLCPLDDEKAVDGVFDSLSHCHVEYLLEAYRSTGRTPPLELVQRLFCREAWSWRALALQTLRAFAYPSLPGAMCSALRQRQVSVEVELSLLREVQKKYSP